MGMRASPPQTSKLLRRSVSSNEAKHVNILSGVRDAALPGPLKTFVQNSKNTDLLERHPSGGSDVTVQHDKVFPEEESPPRQHCLDGLISGNWQGPDLHESHPSGCSDVTELHDQVFPEESPPSQHRLDGLTRVSEDDNWQGSAQECRKVSCDMEGRNWQGSELHERHPSSGSDVTVQHHQVFPEESPPSQHRLDGLTAVSEDHNWQGSAQEYRKDCSCDMEGHNWQGPAQDCCNVRDSWHDIKNQLKPSGPTPYFPKEVRSKQDVEPGDLIHIDRSSTPHRSRTAVVMKVHEAHCTATLLDETLSWGIGEIWPNFSDIMLVSSCWRVGVEVTLSGLTNSRTAGLNGRAGVIVKHVRQGHPSFVQTRTGKANEPLLTLCVKIHLPGGSAKSVLLKPQFLMTRQAWFLSVVHELGVIVADF